MKRRQKRPVQGLKIIRQHGEQLRLRVAGIDVWITLEFIHDADRDRAPRIGVVIDAPRDQVVIDRGENALAMAERAATAQAHSVEVGF